jgi:chromosomal replication initiation ATPase DnaA
MKLHITHPAVRKVIEQCEQQVREMTGNHAVAISFIDDYFVLEFDQIVNIVCKVTKVEMQELQTNSRKTEFVQARQLIAFYARRFTKMNYRSIGQQFGNRDHTTIIASIARINDLIDSGDEGTCNLINKINRKIRQLLDEL